MSDLLASHATLIRGASAIFILLAMAVWEIIAMRRPQCINRRQRWPGNLLIVVIDTLAVRLVFPVTAIGAALFASERGWGLFNTVVTPTWLGVAVSVVVLDMAIYFQHRLFHSVPWLWRVHRMHHADLEFDTTTGLRFHPIEIVISMVFKLGVVIVLGVPVLAILIFEVALNASSLFNHGNVRLSGTLDRWLRMLIVTPDMHRVHHSIVPRETGSNFGFNLPWWDRLFGTYRDQPAAGQLGMTIGIKDFRDSHELRLHRMLIQPFLNARRHARRRHTHNPDPNSANHKS